MLHLALYGLLAVLLAIGLFAVAVRFLPAGEQIAPAVRDEPPWDLPADRRLQPSDIDSIRLPVALRGYRFAETDELLDRLAHELSLRDEEIARLLGHTVSPYGDVLEPPEPGLEPEPELMPEPELELMPAPVAEPELAPVAEPVAEPTAVAEPAADPHDA